MFMSQLGNNMENNIEKRLTTLEVKIDNIEKTLKEIKENHLHSIYRKLEKQDKWLIGVMTAIVLTLVGAILNLMIK